MESLRNRDKLNLPHFNLWLYQMITDDGKQLLSKFPKSCFLCNRIIDLLFMLILG
jgi:hypothetical protein